MAAAKAGLADARAAGWYSDEFEGVQHLRIQPGEVDSLRDTLEHHGARTQFLNL